jgi:EmrB/QacA subfamily drug resistance transporter
MPLLLQASPAPTHERAAAPSTHRWWVLATMTGALSMIMIDQTVVSVALPTMQRDLGLSAPGVQWVVNAYLLLLAVLVALGGRVADLVGPERTFRLGAGLFVLASVLCGVAQGEGGIIAARGLQGVGAALMIPSTGSLLMNAFGVRERGKAMGIYSGVSMIFLALGPLVGGLLTEGVSWRAVFFLNLPIGLLLLAAAHVTLSHPPRRRIPRHAVDWVGIPLLICGVGALVLGLMQGQTWGWTSPAIVGLLAAGAVLLPAFLAWERHAAEPLVRLTLYRRPNFGADSTVLAGVQFALVGASVFGAIWSQQVLGFGPIRAGVAMLPLTIPLLFAAPLAGRAYDRIGPRALLVGGSLLVGAGLAWLALNLHHQDYSLLVPGYVLMGIGIGMTISPATTDALGAAAPAERSQASGMVQTSRQIGGVVGIAILGAIVAHVADAGTAADRATAATSALADAYWTGAAVMAATAVLAFVTVRRRRDG